MHVIETVAADFGYGERAAARNVSLTIDPGERVALLGTNGSGKTTVVRGLLGLAQTMGGQVRLFDTPATDFDERWRIGYVPQRHTVVGAIPSTVREVVSSGRLPRRRLFSRSTAADRAAVDAAIAQVALTDRRNAAVSTLSGGQQRRVLIARALAGEPDLLIMDEPTAGVDTENAERLGHTLKELAAQGLTMLIVTHELAPLRGVLTRAVTLRDGRVISDVPARELTWDAGDHPGHDPRHEAAGPDGVAHDPTRVPRAGLLGDPPVGGN